MTRIRQVVVAILALLLPLGAQGQVAVGRPAFASFAGGPFDTVNLGNLNVRIGRGIPIRVKAGRGLDFSYILSLDSSIWYPASVSGSQTWQPVANWGWTTRTQVATGYVTYRYELVPWCYTGGWVGKYDQWKYYDQLGLAHAFNITVFTGCNYPSSGTATATDGSGFTMTANVAGSISATLYSPAGDVINAPLQSPSGSGTAKDSNGNKITSNGTTFTDTLGTTALTLGGSGTPASPHTFSYTAPSGATASYTMNYAQYSVKTNFGCSGVAEYGPTNVNLVSSITLPDGSSYTFTYEPTPGFAGKVTGRVASVTVPTGGLITYTYTGLNNGITCADGSTNGLTRATPDGTWTYVRTGSNPLTITVTDPEANQTVITFQGIYETERKAYQGSSATGTLLKTWTACYNGNLRRL